MNTLVNFNYDINFLNYIKKPIKKQEKEKITKSISLSKFSLTLFHQFILIKKMFDL